MIANRPALRRRDARHTSKPVDLRWARARRRHDSPRGSVPVFGQSLPPARLILAAVLPSADGPAVGRRVTRCTPQMASVVAVLRCRYLGPRAAIPAFDKRFAHADA